MKLQYLGDSKDAFKWDYLDFLAKQTGMSELLIVPMLTPKGKSKKKENEGQTDPRLFPSSPEVYEFCCCLRENQQLDQLCKLHERTKSNYKVCLYERSNDFFIHATRKEYFSEVKLVKNRILFLDPDIGFEPGTAKKEHVKYSDIECICNNNVDEESIIVIFQHARRMHFPFHEHYKEIVCKLKERNIQWDKTALFWCNQVMFVIMGKSGRLINQVRKINEGYQKLPRPVEVIRGDAG